MSDVLDGLRLPEHVTRTYSFAEIGRVMGSSPEALGAWFKGGGLALLPPLDHVSEKGGRDQSHRLHWRSVALLVIATKLNGFGFGQRNGEAAAAAGAVFTAGLNIDHLCSEDSPMLAFGRAPDGLPRVALVNRDAPVEAVEDPLISEGFGACGTILLDPISVGRIIWRLAMIQFIETRQREDLAAHFQRPAS